MHDDQITVPINTVEATSTTKLASDVLTQTQKVPGEPFVVEFGPVTTVGELRNAQPGPKKRYEDRLENPTPEQVHQHCIEILDQHKKDVNSRKQADKEKQEQASASS